jgi:hypothetical protein
VVSLVRLLQLVPRSQDAARRSRNGKRDCGPRLDNCRIGRPMELIEAPVLEYKKLTAA